MRWINFWTVLNAQRNLSRFNQRFNFVQVTLIIYYVSPENLLRACLTILEYAESRSVPVAVIVKMFGNREILVCAILPVFILQKKIQVKFRAFLIILTYAWYLNIAVFIWSRYKARFLVFRKGGRLAGIQKWHVGGKKLEVVTEYNYLSFLFSTK